MAVSRTPTRRPQAWITLPLCPAFFSASTGSDSSPRDQARSRARAAGRDHDRPRRLPQLRGARVSKGRARTTVRDVPIADRPSVLVWKKRIRRCEQPECEAGSWRETTTAIRPRAVLTERARAWAVRQVGRDALSVAQVARELGVGWHTIMAAVLEVGTRLLADDDRLERVVALGLDEPNFLRGGFRSPTSWVTSFVDLDRGRLLDVVRDRTAMAVQRWIAAQPRRLARQRADRRDRSVPGLRDRATARPAPSAGGGRQFHVIRLGKTVVDEVRRRVQQEPLGHRGRKGDPLYDVRKLLLVARDRLTDHAHKRIQHAWNHGDPWHEVEAAWWGRELLRDVYAANDLTAAEAALEMFFAWADHADVPELSRLARTLKTWRAKVLAYHHRQLSNGRTEAMNLLIKKIKRVGFGFRNFDNYRIRLLLHCGLRWNEPATARIRGRAPSFAA
jgi:transposase